MTEAVEDLGPQPYASKVEAMTGYGLSPSDIARVLDIDVAELKASYPKELAGGNIKANARVAESLYRKAIGEGRESVTAAIFWLKTRARWKETSVHELAGSGGQRQIDLSTWDDDMLDAAIKRLVAEVSAE